MSTQNIPFSIKKKKKKKKRKENHPKLSQICSYGTFSKGLKKRVLDSFGRKEEGEEGRVQICLFMDFLDS